MPDSHWLIVSIDLLPHRRRRRWSSSGKLRRKHWSTGFQSPEPLAEPTCFIKASNTHITDSITEAAAVPVPPARKKNNQKEREKERKTIPASFSWSFPLLVLYILVSLLFWFVFHLCRQISLLVLIYILRLDAFKFYNENLPRNWEKKSSFKITVKSILYIIRTEYYITKFSLLSQMAIARW